MRSVLLLPFTLAVGLKVTNVQDAFPLKRAFGPENRNCRAGSKSRTGGDSSVVGGTIVNDPDKYPFLAWIGDNDGTGLAQFCGGSLIHERVVMTAAHCVYHTDSKNANMYARFNLANFQNNPGVARNIVNWKVHEQFSEISLTNDIALLLLNESATNDEKHPEVHPVALSDGTVPNEGGETNATIVGWGSTDEECRIYDTFLRDSHVPIGPAADECSTPGSKILKQTDIDFHKQICAGYYMQHDMEYPGCGDSGGPLLVFGDQGYTQVGFVSWSYGIPYPDVFTRVSAFRDWIDQHVDDLLKAGEHPFLRNKKTEQAPVDQGRAAAPMTEKADA